MVVMFDLLSGFAFVVPKVASWRQPPRFYSSPSSIGVKVSTYCSRELSPRDMGIIIIIIIT